MCVIDTCALVLDQPLWKHSLLGQYPRFMHFLLVVSKLSLHLRTVHVHNYYHMYKQTTTSQTATGFTRKMHVHANTRIIYVYM